MSEGPDLPARRLDEVKDADVYRFLTTYYLHQDVIFTGRIQTLVLVEGAILAGAFARQGVPSVYVLVFGTWLVWLIGNIAQRDQDVRDQDLDLLDTVHKPKAIMMVRPASSRWRRGSFILKSVLRTLMCINSVLAVLFALYFLFGAKQIYLCGHKVLDIGFLLGIPR